MRGRANWQLTLAVTGAVAVGAVAALLLAWQFEAPGAVRSRAQAPAPSVLTVPLRSGELGAVVNLRADVVAVGKVAVMAPSAPPGELPIVTAVNIAPGSTVHAGQVLFAVALRPVFALQGPIPAFRTMLPGDRGIDVQELQGGLRAIGLWTGSDSAGVYGPGTAKAVQGLYEREGLSASSIRVVTRVGHRRVVTAEAIAPLGEFVFVPSLPERVVSSTLRVGRSASASRPVAAIGSGRAVIRGQVDADVRSVVRRGDRGVIQSDITGHRFPVVVQHIAGAPSSSLNSTSTTGPTYTVTLVPVRGSVATLVGQNVHAQVRTGRSVRRTWIVPAAAVTTSASGATFVTAMVGRHEVEVQVAPGLISGGREAITAPAGKLRRNEPIVIGTS